MIDDGASTSNIPNISIPANRKQCIICRKILYFHQPLLRCCMCKNIFHGVCLKLNNDTTFILQQFSWRCKPCSNVESLDQTCETCFMKIDIFTDKIAQCKQCYKMLHRNCIKSNICLSCLPLPLLYANCSVSDNIENDFSVSSHFCPF